MELISTAPMSKTTPSSLLLFLISLLTATILCNALDSGAKISVNRKPEALALSIHTPPGKYISPSEHVISGLGSLKRNSVVPLRKTTELEERNEHGLKVNAFSSREKEGNSIPGKRRIERREKVEKSIRGSSGEFGPLLTEGSKVVTASGLLLTEGSKVATILNDVVENLVSLRDLVNSLKYQNHVMYRQLKKMQTKHCSSNCHNKMLQEEHHPHRQSPQQDGRYNWRDGDFPNAPGPVSAALRADEDSGTEAGVGPAAADGGVCPAQFSYSRETERCYQLSGDRTTWKTARERCRWMKASLASVDSAREQRVINDMARSNPATHHCDFWIGLTRQGPMSSKDWYWDGDGHLPSFSNWNDNEPNNGNGEEHCTQMLWVFNWRWNDAPCSHGNACFICETRPKVAIAQ